MIRCKNVQKREEERVNSDGDSEIEIEEQNMMKIFQIFTNF